MTATKEKFESKLNVGAKEWNYKIITTNYVDKKNLNNFFKKFVDYNLLTKFKIKKVGDYFIVVFYNCYENKCARTVFRIDINNFNLNELKNITKTKINQAIDLILNDKSNLDKE